MVNVDHKSTKCVKQGMLIPCGTVFEEQINDLRPGDLIITAFDDPPMDCKVIASAKIPMVSEQANAMANLLYGYPIETVYSRMKGSYGKRISNKFVHLIIYEEL